MYSTAASSSFVGGPDFDEDDVSVGGGVWVESRDENGEEEHGKGKDAALVAYDAQGVGHPREATLSATGSAAGTGTIHSGWRTWGVDAGPSRQQCKDPPANRSQRDRWAKIKVRIVSRLPVRRHPF